MPVAAGIVEQFAREGRCIAITVQQIPEPLELVEDHQVRFEGLDARRRQDGAKPADEPNAGPCVEARAVGVGGELLGS